MIYTVQITMNFLHSINYIYIIATIIYYIIINYVQHKLHIYILMCYGDVSCNYAVCDSAMSACWLAGKMSYNKMLRIVK